MSRLDLDLNINGDSAAKIIKKGVAGGLKDFLGYACLILFVGIIVASTITMLANRYAPAPVDSSDISATQRSGLTIRTDALTGCQYLETAAGAITPRMGGEGKQICGGAQ